MTTATTNDAELVEQLGDEYDSYLRTWTRSLRGGSEGTLKTYTTSARQFREWLCGRDDPDEVPEPVERPATLGDLRREHVDGWVAALAARGLSDSTISNRYRGLQAFLKFLTEQEDVFDVHPMAAGKAPKVAPKRVETVPVEELKALLATCSTKAKQGKKLNTFVQRRDEAILRLYMDTGGRLTEVAGAELDDVDTKRDVLHAIGKNGKPRQLSFGQKTGIAIERYLRERAKHPAAKRVDGLWLPERGSTPLTSNGIHQMIQRRCERAGIKMLHAHLFRHTMATAYLDEGGDANDLMHLMDWESHQMLKRYTDTTAKRRAVLAHKKRSLGDRL